jgi:hypothetical protein
MSKMSGINYWGVEGYIDTSGYATQSWSDTASVGCVLARTNVKIAPIAQIGA